MHAGFGKRCHQAWTKILHPARSNNSYAMGHGLSTPMNKGHLAATSKRIPSSKRTDTNIPLNCFKILREALWRQHTKIRLKVHSALIAIIMVVQMTDDRENKSRIASGFPHPAHEQSQVFSYLWLID